MCQTVTIQHGKGWQETAWLEKVKKQMFTVLSQFNIHCLELKRAWRRVIQSIAIPRGSAQIEGENGIQMVGSLKPCVPSRGSDGKILVRYRTVPKSAQANQDFVPSEGELVFEEGQTSNDITIQIIDDDLREPTEKLEVQLLDPTPAPGVINFEGFISNPTVVISIIDDDMKPGTFKLERPSYEVFENDGTITIGVIRTDGTDGEISVKYKTIPKTAQFYKDFIPVEGELVFGEKQNRKDIVIKIVDDEVRESTKTFEVQLLDPKPGVGVINFRRFMSNPTAVISIRDNDMKPGILLLEKPSYTAYENGGTIELAVVRREGQDGQVRVRFQTIPQSAQDGQDFETQMGDLVFEEGELRKQIRIKIQDDNVREPEEIFEVRLLDPTPGPGTINFRGLGITPSATVTIIDDDMNAGVLELERGIYEVMEDAGVVRVNVVRTGGQDGRITVQYQTKSLTANENRDFVPVSGELVFEEGELRKSIEVRIQDDTEEGTLETLEVLLLNPIPGPGILKFRGFGSIEKAVIRIVDNDMTPGILVLEKDSFEVGESDGVIQIGVVRLDGVDGQIQVHYQTVPKTAAAGKDFESVSGDLVFEPGQTRKTIPIRILNDDIREPSKYFAIQLMDPIAGVGVINFRGLGQIPAAVITILDDDMRPGILQFERPSYEIFENVGTLTIRVVRLHGTDGEIRVKYRTVATNAVVNQDFVHSEGELIFNEREDKKDITIRIVDDDIREPTKAFQVQILDPEPGLGVINFRGLGPLTTTLVTINDNDTRCLESRENIMMRWPKADRTVTIGVVRLDGLRRRDKGEVQNDCENSPGQPRFRVLGGRSGFRRGSEQKGQSTIQVIDDDVRGKLQNIRSSNLDATPGLVLSTSGDLQPPKQH
ncbi:Adhesion G-protein coupled receptor V1 like protein [Argiope bruennichi]|uniref:Adhesion G-protein coupled receptor V1 like protein n=1 Tax=Argiope bruennichi TaxID=94029 RepID=A0A8T0EBR0_ARGBR|nr:Adhesion G-protein coupled receptor V1 like protein [Argiope bruennichi]